MTYGFNEVKIVETTEAICRVWACVAVWLASLAHWSLDRLWIEWNCCFLGIVWRRTLIAALEVEVIKRGTTETVLDMIRAS